MPGSLDEFAEDLRQLRLRAGQPSTRAIAGRTGISHDTVHRVFQGGRVPRWESVAQVLAALEITEVEPWRERWAALHERESPAEHTWSIHPTSLAGLPRWLYERFAGAATRRGFQPGDVLLRQGEQPEVVALLESGVAKQFQHSPSGEVQLHDILLPGRFLGFEAPALYTSRASTECLTLAMPVNTFRDLALRTPGLALAERDELAIQLRWQAHRLQCLGMSSVERTVASILCALADRLGGPGAAVRLDFRWSQQELASMAGVSASALSRELRSLLRAGIVAAGRGWLEIRDPQTLRERAGLPRTAPDPTL